MDEMRQGLYCSKCHRSKSEIEASGENFYEHIQRVQGQIVPASQEELDAKQQEYEQKVSDLEQQLSGVVAQRDQAVQEHQAEVRQGIVDRANQINQGYQEAAQHVNAELTQGFAQLQQETAAEAPTYNSPGVNEEPSGQGAPAPESVDSQGVQPSTPESSGGLFTGVQMSGDITGAPVSAGEVTKPDPNAPVYTDPAPNLVDNQAGQPSSVETANSASDSETAPEQNPEESSTGYGQLFSDTIHQVGAFLEPLKEPAIEAGKRIAEPILSGEATDFKSAIQLGTVAEINSVKDTAIEGMQQVALAEAKQMPVLDGKSYNDLSEDQKADINIYYTVTQYAWNILKRDWQGAWKSLNEGLIQPTFKGMDNITHDSLFDSD